MVLTQSKVLIGVPVKNCAQWVEMTAQQILNLSYPKEFLTVAFVENDSEDDSYAVLRDKVLPRFAQCPYRAVHLAKHDTGFKLSHFRRHLAEVFVSRYKAMSEIRNFIIDNYLSDNDFLCWIDADWESIPRDMVERLMAFNVDLIAPIFVTPDRKIYGLGTKKRVNGVWLTADKIAASHPNEGIVEVDKLEAVLINRRVFDAGVNSKGLAGQESITFMQRAKEKGFKLWLATKVTVVHARINGMLQ